PDDQALGHSRGGFSTKIHVMVDALGNPLDFILIGKLKQFRRVFSRFDKWAKNFMNFVRFASALIW
ncbi:MAG: Mobile element protein, partial [Olavius algarvensis Gamma 1 endosymbiont]